MVADACFVFKLSEVQILFSPFLSLFTTTICLFGSYNQKYLFGKAHVGQLGIGQLLNHIYKGAKVAENTSVRHSTDALKISDTGDILRVFAIFLEFFINFQYIF